MSRRITGVVVLVAFMVIAVFVSSAQSVQTECLETIIEPEALKVAELVEDVTLDYALCASMCLSIVQDLEYIASSTVYFETCLLVCFVSQDNIYPVVSDGINALFLCDFGKADLYGSTDSNLSVLNRHLVVTDEKAVLYHIDNTGEAYNEDLLWVSKSQDS